MGELTGCGIQPRDSRQRPVAGRQQAGGTVMGELTRCGIQPRDSR